MKFFNRYLPVCAAVCWTGANKSELELLAGYTIPGAGPELVVAAGVEVPLGDWLLRSPEGELRSMGRTVFEEVYAKVAGAAA